MATAKQIREEELRNPEDPNVRDPEHAHELGGTVGMSAGGVAGGIAGGMGAAAVAATAIGGTLGASAGPIGAVVGAAIGGAIGGAIGERVAREVNPTAEEKYWEENYRTRPYVVSDRDFDTYRPAYRYGIDSYDRYEGKSFDDVEADMSGAWPQTRGVSTLEWNEAREPVRDAYDRLNTRTIKQVK